MTPYQRRSLNMPHILDEEVQLDTPYGVDAAPMRCRLALSADGQKHITPTRQIATRSTISLMGQCQRIRHHAHTTGVTTELLSAGQPRAISDCFEFLRDGQFNGLRQAISPFTTHFD